MQPALLADRANRSGLAQTWPLGVEQKSWPLPFVFLSRGAGIFLAESADPRAELASRYPDAIRFSARSGPLHLYFISGEKPEEVLKKFNRLQSPRATLPAEAFMPWMALDLQAVCQGEATAEMMALRQLGIPAQNLLIHGPLLQGNLGPDSCPGLVPTLQKSQELGFNLVFSDQVLVPWGTPEFKTMSQRGFLVVNRMGLPYFVMGKDGPAAILDLSDSHLAKARAELWTRLKSAGFAGMALDPACLLPPEALLKNGMSGEEARNLFPLLYAQAAREAWGQEAILISRVGFAGMEKFAVMAWPTPTRSSSSEPEDHPGVISLGMNGIVSGPPLPPEVTLAHGLSSSLLSSLSLAAASGLMIMPSGIKELAAANQTEAIKALSLLGEIHSRLLPYFYSLHQHQEGGEYLLAPVALISPTESELYHLPGQFLLGEALLVSLTDSVRFPLGRWVHLETMGIYQRGNYQVGGGLGPRLFLREGQILPVFSRGFQTLASSPATEGKRGGLDHEITLLWISGQPARRVLFDGTLVSAGWGLETLALRVLGGDPRTYTWRVLWCAQPKEIYLNGKKLGDDEWQFQDTTGLLTIPHLRGPDLSLEVMFPSLLPENE